MWSYYGSKSKVVDSYPPPKYGKIIEPFAGSARYSLKFFDRDITLVDKYEVIVCENTKATWLPFRAMKELNGSIHTTTEAIWSNFETAYDMQQMGMFA